LAGKEAFLVPQSQEPFPECPPAPDMSGQLVPVAEDEFRSGEGPHVWVASLPQDLPDQSKSLGIGSRLQPFLDFADSEGVVPSEIRKDLGIANIGTEELG